ncbi:MULTISPECIES: transcription elongation factor GreA [Companilactobacillus]|jgi:transcription elongation factor GreA|uniref:Transcription elongation factor GreA n=1 Tax=Companilactobacillus pabuli TaxID=2714036 RepID=A0A7L7KX90_9LACO|nr:MULTISPECIES: transcription elongation factor GreA [Companilactobacillus]AKP03652.1 transcription elongation factor GreA [Companilactobacillus farciminis]AKS51957.1 transcription elongation factor GreA [Companilactobacillus farciminis]MDG5112860.1 transcription elongation factor GreA [Companilactobacillus pabuli]QMT84365.1 transcription elongation factor GreA [Companilactobacillus pabuli]GAQ00509.1 transcription elongation factor GreA [Companilactobacillus farciminis]
MADRSYPMTAEGKKKLEEELENLKKVKRPEVINRIKIARSFGDLSENSEYTSAKDEQSVVESRISQIIEMLQYANVIDADDVAHDEISIGKKVTVQEDGEEPDVYTIVGAAESDPDSGKISNDSPIAKALLGKHTGDVVTVETPVGSYEVTVKAVEVA